MQQTDALRGNWQSGHQTSTLLRLWMLCGEEKKTFIADLRVSLPVFLQKGR